MFIFFETFIDSLLNFIRVRFIIFTFNKPFHLYTFIPLHHYEKDAVGKRYRRQDAAGTPFCITVDHDTLEDNCVTIRHRDTMEQKRVAIADLKDLIKAEVEIKTWLQKM